MAGLRRIISGVCLSLLSSLVTAIEWNGELKWQQSLAHAAANSQLAIQAGDWISLSQSQFRMRMDHQQAGWSFDVDYLLAADYSEDLLSLQSASDQASTSVDFFDWQHQISRNNSRVIDHRLDRANIKYASDHWVVKLGRQAISWGNGVVFHPMDLFNPFSPDVKDTSYKPGIDALYSQYLFSQGDDLQLLWIPRKNPLSGQVDADLQSTAVKYLGFVNSLQFDVLVADDYRQKVYGLGVAGPLGYALWKLDLVYNERMQSSSVLSMDLNLQTSWMWGERPLTGFVEYYRNGFAPANIGSLQQLPVDLVARFNRGQLFVVGENFLAAGVQMQWSPLLIVSTNLISQMDDHSLLLLTSFTYNSSQSSNWIGGVQLAAGPKGSEYGGYYLDDFRQVTAQPADQIYLRYEWYF